MALYIRTNGYEGQAINDLNIIIEGDVSTFGDDPATDPDGNQALQVQYVQNLSSFSCDRINDIVNNLADTVEILAVDSTYVLPDGNPVDSELGFTTPHPDWSGTVYSVYDWTDCNGAHAYAWDAQKGKIPFPPPVLLFHELCHAYHILNGDEATNYEFQAETDEDSFRTEQGLPLRNPTDHGGGCGGPPPPDTTGGSSSGDCLIVTAAYGSPLAPPLTMLRKLRDGLLHQSRFGHAVYDKVCGEYYQFSPMVAAHMRADPELRQAITMVGVEPLLAFFTLGADYLRMGWQDEQFSERVEQSLTNFISAWTATGYDNDRISSIARILQSADFEKKDHRFQYNGKYDIPASRTDPLSALYYLGRQISIRLPSAEYILWALLAPLQRYWAAVSSKLKESPDDRAASLTLINELERWLSVFPIPSVAYADHADLCTDLHQMARSVFTNPMIRHIVGRRMLASLSEQPIDDLSECLKEADFLPMTV